MLHFLQSSQIVLAVFLSATLFGPPLLHLLFGDSGQRLLCRSLTLILTDSLCQSATLVALVANYAFITGLLFSLTDPLGGGSGIGTGIGSGYFYPSVWKPNSTDADYSSKASSCHARSVVGLAFDSGRAQRFSWPPHKAVLEVVFGPDHMEQITSGGDAKRLFDRVYPSASGFFVIPMLIYILFALLSKIICRLSICWFVSLSLPVVMYALGTTDYYDPTWPTDKLPAVETWGQSETLADPGQSSDAERPASTSKLQGINRLASFGQFRIFPFTMPMKAMFKKISSMPTLPGRLGDMASKAGKMAGSISKTVAGGVVDMLAPFVFGSMLIVTTATGIVLYGVGHVGVARVAESGIFGLNKDAIDTLLELVNMQCRFMRQLRWSWWLSAAARYGERYQHHFVYRHEHDHEHHDCLGIDCPIHSHTSLEEEHVHGDDEDQHLDDPAVTSEAPRRHHSHHHHHHHHHHHGPADSIVHHELETRRDWLRFLIFGRGGRHHKAATHVKASERHTFKSSGLPSLNQKETEMTDAEKQELLRKRIHDRGIVADHHSLAFDAASGLDSGADT